MAEIANNSIDIQVVETGGENAQYFWHNTTDSGAGEGAGAHITEIPRADFVADPENGGGNTLINSSGLSVRNGTDTRANFSGNEIKLYTADGVPAFVVKSGSGSGSQTVTKVISQTFDMLKNTNYAKTYSDIDSVGSGETFDVSIFWGFGVNADQHDTQTFTKGTSSVETYTICTDDYGDDFATITATYNGVKQITWRFTTHTDPSMSGFYITIDTISYTAIVSDATTEVSGNMVWKNPDQVFVMKEYTVVNNQTITSYGNVSGTENITESGYYPVGVVGWRTNTRYVLFSRLVLEDVTVGSCNINYLAYNAHTQSHSATLSASVLWVKAE